jgi:hypothetical protein
LLKESGGPTRPELQINVCTELARVKQHFGDTESGKFSTHEFTDSRLGHIPDSFQISALESPLINDFQDCFMQLGFQLQFEGCCRLKSELVKNVAF